MRAIIVAMVCMAVLAPGCKKNKKAVENASSVDGSEGGQAPAVGSTQVAEGDMRDILLALRRVHFSFDTTTLEPVARAALDDAAQKLRSMTDVDLYVDGHTDERGTTEYNMSLGERRAQTVVGYLKDSGVDSARLRIVSFGEEKPMAAGTGEVQLAQNRRVEYRLMKGDIHFKLEEGDLVDDKGAVLSEGGDTGGGSGGEGNL